MPDVTGLLSYVEQHRAVVSIAVPVDFDNLSTVFDSYVFKYRLHIRGGADNDYLRIQFLDSSGTVIAGSSYGYSRVQQGTNATSNTMTTYQSYESRQFKYRQQ